MKPRSHAILAAALFGFYNALPDWWASDDICAITNDDGDSIKEADVRKILSQFAKSTKGKGKI